MPIEFPCPRCTQQLRVPDTAAGKEAKCPKCGEIARIPVPVAASQPAWGFSDRQAEPKPGGTPFASPSANPYAAPAPVTFTDARQSFGSLPIAPQAVGVEPILGHAWEVWKANLGLLVGVTVVAMIINFVSRGILDVVEREISRNDPQTGAIFGLLLLLVRQAVQIFLGIGQTRIALKLARGEQAHFGELFSGGPWFFPAYLMVAGYWIALIIGVAFLVVPGVLLALVFWPFYFLYIDDKTTALESIATAPNVSANNWGTAFILGLLSLGIIILGLLTLCIGIIFAAPLVTMIWAVAYLMMAGQLPPGQQYRGYEPKYYPA
jgi:uncharacterized membrane protein